ncbi:MAG: hypothetical protein HYR67_11755 [Bacteroidetes bacterium]|nr:hypothetical protein [Bacteroidota bacterium]
MDIIFKKGNTKNTITCKRSESSSTWMEADRFMIAHDLTHFAVEKQLQIGKGFYGLVASGLDITDFEKKQKITPQQLPKESIKTELIVNLILTERHDGKKFESFDEAFNSLSKQFGISNEKFDADDLNKIHSQLNELLNHWAMLPVNESMIIKL